MIHHNVHDCTQHTPAKVQGKLYRDTATFVPYHMKVSSISVSHDSRSLGKLGFGLILNLFP